MGAPNIKLDKMLAQSHLDRSDLEISDIQRSQDHQESHSDYGDVIRDVIIGFADGLTVPFAVTAGLSS